MKDVKDLNPHNYETTPILDANLAILFERVTEFQDAYGKEFQITSGLRSDAQQEELIKEGKTNAIHSKHLIGSAADILDSDGSLTQWVKDNLDVMSRIGLWMEDFDSIASLAEKHHSAIWVHVQSTPPASGKRVFIP